MPMFIVLVMLIFQLSLWWHAKATADFAAEQGVAAARITTARPNAGFEAANTILSQTGNLRATVTETRDANRVIIEVRGVSPGLVPFAARDVYGLAEAPLERFVPREER